VLPSDEQQVHDPETTDSILELLLKINRELGITILLITHEMNVIQKYVINVYVHGDESLDEMLLLGLFVTLLTQLLKFLNTISPA